VGGRVLVVDDDPGVRSLVALICRRAGCHADEASDGAEALRLLDQNFYSVVVLDLQMPMVNGFDVVAQLKTRRPRPCVLVLSALPRIATATLDADVVQAVVRKPFDIDMLSGLVSDLAASEMPDYAKSESSTADGWTSTGS
jgi:DNA-binding response OmpR family regulator